MLPSIKLRCCSAVSVSTSEMLSSGCYSSKNNFTTCFRINNGYFNVWNAVTSYIKSGVVNYSVKLDKQAVFIVTSLSAHLFSSFDPVKSFGSAVKLIFWPMALCYFFSAMYGQNNIYHTAKSFDFPLNVGMNLDCPVPFTLFAAHSFFVLLSFRSHVNFLFILQ